MADPIIVAGTAAGVVSLGLQVFGALKEYLDDFNSRDERVARTLGYLARLKETLDVIDIATRSLQSTHQAPSDAVMSCLRSCETEMTNLVGQLHDHEPLQHNNTKEKVKGFLKRIQYPFKVSSIKEIEESLERIISKLSLAINGLGLHSHLKISAGVDYLNDAIKPQATVLAKIESDLGTQYTLNTANASQLTSISTSIQPLQPMIQRLESVAKDRFDKFENQVQINHSVTTNRLDILESRSEASTKVITELLSIFRNSEDQSLLMNQEHLEKRLVLPLLSKPSLLKDVQELLDFQHEEVKSIPDMSTSVSKHLNMSWTRTMPGTSKCCSYMTRRRVNEHVTRWYTFDFFAKETTTSVHRVGCPRYKSYTREHQKEFGITYAGLQRLCSAAVSVGLCLRYGSGGAGISPVFRYHYVVDPWQSPPFRILELLLTALFTNAIHTSAPKAQNVIMCSLSWIATAYDRKVATPWDVTINREFLIDYFCRRFWRTKYESYAPLILSRLLDLGVIAARPELLTGRLNDSLPVVLSLMLQKVPNLRDQYKATAINLLRYGDAVRQSSELSAAIEPDLDMTCTALLHKGLDGLSEALATNSKIGLTAYQVRPGKSFQELLMRWPAGLKYILEMQRGFLTPAKLNSLFNILCLSQYALFDDDHLSELIKVLLENGCHLAEANLARLFRLPRNSNMPTKTIRTILQHVKSWRERLREALQTYLPVDSEEHSILSRSEVLQLEASQVVSRLRTIGLDPFEMFGLQQGDYRLYLPSEGYDSIFHIVDTPAQAQMAYDLGFRGIDFSHKSAPLSMLVNPSNGYCEWLIGHGADYTRKMKWAYREPNQGIHTIGPPRYLVAHWILRRLSIHKGGSLPGLITSMAQSPWASNFTQSNCYDGCSCACLSSPQGCSPFVIFLNIRVQLGSLALEDLMQDLDILIGANGQFSITAESIIRCLTFRRLGIRHTCCTSLQWMEYDVEDFPCDYGSDFEELREEDSDRILQLDDLVPKFVNQYENSGLSLEDFITGSWTEEMDRIEEEKSMKWTREEKDTLLSIGVVLEDDTESTQSLEEYGWDAERETPEYWNKQFEIIVNGGRSVEERWR